MSSSKRVPKPSSIIDVSNVTPGQPGGSIWEHGESHGLGLVSQCLELSRYVDKLFTVNVTLLNSIGLTAPACLTPADFKPFGEVVLSKLSYTASCAHFNATSLDFMLQSSSMDLPFPNMATYEQLQHINTENLDLEKLDLSYYNASLLFSSNQAIKKKLPTGFRRPSIISTCKRAILSEDLDRSTISWTPTQIMALENDETRDMAQMAANKL